MITYNNQPLGSIYNAFTAKHDMFQKVKMLQTSCKMVCMCCTFLSLLYLLTTNLPNKLRVSHNRNLLTFEPVAGKETPKHGHQQWSSVENDSNLFTAIWAIILQQIIE